MNNIHGSRANTDRLQRKGSGYTASHGPDFLLANDSWSQMLNFRYGPDGSVYAIDWYDKNQCHSSNPELHQKTLGRIFKISHDNDKWVTGRSPEAVVGRSWSSCSSIATTGTCATRGASCRSAGPIRRCTPRSSASSARIPDVTRKLRALWALHVTDGLTRTGARWSCSDTRASTCAAGRST